MKGTYCLIINLKEKSTIKIGSLGKINFDKGCYIYIGSAMNSIIARIKRHLSDDKKLHWHIDYLLKDQNSEIIDVIFTISTKKLECKLSEFINKKSNNKIDKFGSSDCNCESHLYYFKKIKNAKIECINAYQNNNMSYFDLKYFNENLNK
ncbi:DUF123 domain-containing protein [uncultured Methanobrevibacter sp.]|uniref:GIY-YIG nuclease family protein n=1 Tax=uncultured Methanobrevibacter sp. TaxID=253161 RepID=UPI0025FD21B3|nr:GIY-YIG nuclease family protein [uncultured Methanobrevibacter sp.]